MMPPYMYCTSAVCASQGLARQAAEEGGGDAMQCGSESPAQPQAEQEKKRSVGRLTRSTLESIIILHARAAKNPPRPAVTTSGIDKCTILYLPCEPHSLVKAFAAKRSHLAWDLPIDEEIDEARLTYSTLVPFSTQDGGGTNLAPGQEASDTLAGNREHRGTFAGARYIAGHNGVRPSLPLEPVLGEGENNSSHLSVQIPKKKDLGPSEIQDKHRGRSLLQSFSSLFPSIVLHPAVSKDAEDSAHPPTTTQHNQIADSSIGSIPQSPPFLPQSIIFQSPTTLPPDLSLTPSTPASPNRMPPPIPTSFWDDQLSSRRISSPPTNDMMEPGARSSQLRYKIPSHHSPPSATHTSRPSLPIFLPPQIHSPPRQQYQQHQQNQQYQQYQQYTNAAAILQSSPQIHQRHSSLSPHIALTYSQGNRRPTQRLRKSNSSTAISSSLPQPDSSPPVERALSDGQVRPRANSVVPPKSSDLNTAPRRISPDNSRRSSLQPEPEGEREPRPRRRSWGFGGLRSSRNVSEDGAGLAGSRAWLDAAGHKTDYDLSPLMAAEKVPEIWDDAGNIFVYLFPEETKGGPSFRVSSEILSSSSQLVSLIHGSVYSDRSRGKSVSRRATLSADDAMRHLVARGIISPPITPQPSPQGSDSDGLAESVKSLSDPPKDIHMYFPAAELNPKATPGSKEFPAEDIQRLVDIRNLFAFLLGIPLVATRKSPTVFYMLLSVSTLLRQFEFTNLDGSTFGEVAATRFNSYMEEFELADVSQSREKTIEGLVLGEQMRSTDLYNQAFVHAVGKCEAIMTMQSPLFNEISQITRNRLQRAHLDLLSRQRTMKHRLEDFDFPSLWVGIAASTSIAEVKSVRFKAWKSSFAAMRRHVLSYYKDLYGSWPPKASSKRNSFVEGGLNRLVLQQLYSDFCNLYDLLTDRKSLTTRQYEASDDELDVKSVNRDAAALRKVLSEWDRSSPPVQPPVPFDVPMVPTLTTIMSDYTMLSPEDQRKVRSRKLRGDEYQEIMRGAQNTADCDLSNLFIVNFKHFEEKEGKGKSAQELADNRYGYWIFIYVVLQSLPMLAVDAPGLKYSDGVEYFLCEPPIGNVPWLENSSAVTRAWYGVQGGTAVVSLPSDLVNYSVEGIYHRSHCWTVADKWITAQEEPGDSYVPTRSFELPGPDMIPSRVQSPADADVVFLPPSRSNTGTPTTTTTHFRQLSMPTIPLPAPDEYMRNRSRKRQSIALGLEQLPIPAMPSNDLSSALSAVDELEVTVPAGDEPASTTGGEDAQANSRGASPNPINSRNRYRRSAGDRRVSGQYTGSNNGSRVGSASLDIPVPLMPQNEGATFDSILGDEEDKQRSRSRSRRRSWFPEVLDRS
ncbi:hypothetical protein B7463_g9677, partial [Scytalidium lignicola]